MAELYPINGILYDTDESTAIASATVRLRNENTNEVITATTNALGQFVLESGNFASGWTNGDYLTLYVIYQNFDASITLQINTTNDPDGLTQNLILSAVTADGLRYFTAQEFLDTFGMVSSDQDSNNGLDPQIIVKVGRSIEARIDQLTKRRWDNNDGNYATTTQELHNASGQSRSWPDNQGTANISAQHTYWTKNRPIKALTTFQVNKNGNNQTASWSTLTEASNEITVRKALGRIQIADASDYPASGLDQIRITYTYGEDSTPEDIKRLAILMTGKAMGGQALQKLNIDVSEAEGLSEAINNLVGMDKEIESIINSRKFSEIRII